MSNILQKVLVEGVYSFRIVNSKTKEERNLEGVVAKDHPNLILDSGLDALGTEGVDCAIGCSVGTGSTPVDVSQTTLDTFLASTEIVTSTSSDYLMSAQSYKLVKRTYQFEAGSIEGDLTEVGVYTTISGNPLFSRALLIDDLGNPTALPVMIDEDLYVTYELRLYVNESSVITYPTMNGNVYTVIMRPALVAETKIDNGDGYFKDTLHREGDLLTLYNGNLNSILNYPAGDSYTIVPIIEDYVSGSYSRTFSVSLGLEDGNDIFWGITAMLINTYKSSWQIGFSPAIYKNNLKTLAFSYTIQWGRKA